MTSKIGLKTCPKWLHTKYRESVNFTCQNCHKHENEVGKLIPHRLKRKIHGGLYTVAKLNSKENNIKIVCQKCHKLFHAKENKNIQSNK